MCGFGLIVDRERAVDRAALARMGEAMALRGPDAEGVWLSEGADVGMVHRRLSIIDLSSAANQPMSSEHGLVVSFNGEVYNFRELRRELEAAGYVFRTQSDTEVLLHGYHRWGASLPGRLVGMFAFAIWDPRDHSVFLARDHFGIKPMYFSSAGRRFVAASTTAAILASGLVPTRYSEAGTAGFYLWGSVPEPFTVFEGIESLPAGHAARVDAQGHVWKEKYWSVTDCLAQARASTNGVEAAQLLRDALRDSVRRHLIADVPVGFFLSAGRDSSALVGVAKELGVDVRALTLGFKEFAGTHKDEVPLAKLVAQQYGCQHDVIWTSEQDFRDEEQRYFASMDQPTIDGVNTYFVSRAAAKAGLKVVISGVGADEVLGGYPSFEQIPSLVNGVRASGVPVILGKAARKLLSGVFGYFSSPKYAGVLEYGGNWGGAYLLRRSLFMPWELNQMMGPQAAARGFDALNAVATANAIADPLESDHAKVAALELSLYMRNVLLRDSDWASMAHSLELRTPFVDVGLFSALAPALLASAAGAWPSKGDLVRCPTPPLPPAVANRAKTGFEVPVRQWLAQGGRAPDRGLRNWAHHVAHRFGLPQEGRQDLKDPALSS